MSGGMGGVAGGSPIPSGPDDPVCPIAAISWNAEILLAICPFKTHA